MTVDVESFSIPLNKCDEKTGEQVNEYGLPILLDLFNKFDVHGTFFFTGMMAEKFPDSVKLVRDNGHEIGCHGYDHSHLKAFDYMVYEDQLLDLERAKSILNRISGKVDVFRAPALRLNTGTIKALEKTGFCVDSSVCSQRFDGPFTFGSKEKINWLTAPRMPYYLSYDSVYKRGNSTILEIPVSALGLSYSGTTLRRAPGMLKLLQRLLLSESSYNEKPLTFLIHPNECIEPGNLVVPTRRADNYIQYLFADKFRQKLKLKNLGAKCVTLLDEMLHSAKKFDVEFLTVSDYKKGFLDRNEY